MTEFADLILRSGRAAVELAFFILLPVMIAMLTLLRLLEARGVLDRIVSALTPVLGPLGVPGLGVFALLQVLFVSFAAPLATLAMMEKGRQSRRHIAATLALVFGAAQANVVFPLSALGLHGVATLAISAAAALIGAAATYHWFARAIPAEDEPPEPTPKHRTADDTKGVLGVIQHAGGEAFGITINALPILVLSLLLVNALRALGAVDLLEHVTAPVFAWLDLPASTALLLISKAIAGGTAMMGIAVDMLQQGAIDAVDVNRVAGLLINPFDLVGIALLISAGPRVASVLRPAIYGALVAVVLRTLVHLLLW